MRFTFLRLVGVVAAVACGSAASSNSTGNTTPTSPNPPTPVASQLAIRVNPFGTRLGIALATQPIVEVRDANGQLYTAGSVTVTAQIASGGGTLSGKTSASSVGGVATFTDLAITGTDGDRTLVFSATGVASVTSRAFTLAAGPPARLTIVTPPSGLATVWTPLVQQPVVQLLDDAGVGIATATPVTASVVSGNGAIVAGTSAVTGADGRATFSTLTLGAVDGKIGAVSLRFTAANISSAEQSVTLTCGSLPLTFGTAVSGSLRAGDCKLGGGLLYKSYGITIPTSATVLEVSEDATMHPAAWLQSPLEPNGFYWGFGSPTQQHVNYKAFIAPGAGQAAASHWSVGETGSYSMTVSQASADLTNCEGALLLNSFVSAQQLGVTDCKDDAGFYYDSYGIGLQPGVSVTATVSAAYAAFVGVWQDTGYVTWKNGATSLTVTYKNTGTSSKFVYIDASSTNSNVTGPYTVVFAVAYSAASTNRSASSVSRGAPTFRTEEVRTTGHQRPRAIRP
jgi:hypothetical protein